MVILGYLAFVINGMLAVITGAVLTYIANDFGFTYSCVAMIVTTQSIGNMIMVLLSGGLIAKLGRKKVMCLFPVLFALGFFIIASTDKLAIMYLAAFITGLGWGACNNVIHLLIMENCTRNNHKVTILHTSYAAGSGLGPLLLNAVMILQLGWRISLYIIALLSIILTVLFMLFAEKARKTNLIDKRKTQEKIGVRHKLDLQGRKHFGVCAVLYFTYVGVESCVNAWLVTLLVKNNGCENNAAMAILSVLWIVIIIGRLLYLMLGRFVSEIKFLVVQWLCVIVACLLLLQVNGPVASTVCTVVLAFFMAGMSPGIAISASDFIRGNGVSSGMLFSAGCIGSAVMPFVVGIIVDYSDIKMGFVFVLAMMVIALVASIANVRDRNYC